MCAHRHDLEAFPPRTRVVILDTIPVDEHGTIQVSGRLHEAILHYAGRHGRVVEWGQYGGPLWIRVEIDGGARFNFYPCQLEHE